MQIRHIYQVIYSFLGFNIMKIRSYHPDVMLIIQYQTYFLIEETKISLLSQLS